MPPAMKKRAAPADAAPVDPTTQSIRDLDHKLFDVYETYNNGKNELMEKMKNIEMLEEDAKTTDKKVDECKKVLEGLEESQKKMLDAHEQFKFDSAAYKRQLGEIERLVRMIEQTQAVIPQEEVMTAQNTVLITNRLNTVGKDTAEILTQVRCLASQQVESVYVFIPY